jgi:CheY-like chemotaxis protein
MGDPNVGESKVLRPLSILVVDDDDAMRKLLRVMLRERVIDRFLGDNPWLPFARFAGHHVLEIDCGAGAASVLFAEGARVRRSEANENGWAHRVISGDEFNALDVGEVELKSVTTKNADALQLIRHKKMPPNWSANEEFA